MADLYAKLNLPRQRIFVKDASFLRRATGFLADLLILDFAAFGAFQSLFIGGEPSRLLAGDFSLTPAMYAAAVVMALLALTYFMLFEYLLGQTPGMMLVAIKAENVTLWRAFVRNLYFIPVFPFPLLWVVEPLYLAFRKTRFLEIVSGTRTVEYIAY